MEDPEYSSAELYRNGKLIASGPVSEVQVLAQPGDWLKVVRRTDGLVQEFQAIKGGSVERGVNFIMLPLGPPEQP
jgi:hypothetical protein